MSRKPVARKTLSAAGLLTTLRACFERIEESVACFCGIRPAGVYQPLTNCPSNHEQP